MPFLSHIKLAHQNVENWLFSSTTSYIGHFRAQRDLKYPLGETLICKRWLLQDSQPMNDPDGHTEPANEWSRWTHRASQWVIQMDAQSQPMNDPDGWCTEPANEWSRWTHSYLPTLHHLSHLDVCHDYFYPVRLIQSKPSILQESGRGVLPWRRWLPQERIWGGNRPPMLPQSILFLHHLLWFL